GDIDDDYLKLLLDNYHLEIHSNEDSFEYIYLTDDLINLKGNKYHKKRNHYNNFIKLYDYNINSIDNEKIINDCINLLDKWENTKYIYSKELLEPTAVKSILFSLENLSLKSIAVYVNGNIAGFSIGEKINDSAIIHIEKCNTEYRGIYAFINNEFLKLHFKDTIYVNRQEDCGNNGLQQSKESYHPHLVLKKYLIKIK
ncbi:MAG: phosphatidylglycerol lysyltransferase domain-containing protein, partial [Peptostreptococcaceae bacterium]